MLNEAPRAPRPLLHALSEFFLRLATYWGDTRRAADQAAGGEPMARGRIRPGVDGCGQLLWGG